MSTRNQFYSIKITLKLKISVPETEELWIVELNGRNSHARIWAVLQQQFFIKKSSRLQVTVFTLFKGTVPRDFRLLFFFHESVSPKPLSIPIEPFRIFSKIRGDIRSSRCTTGVADTGDKWQKSSNWQILIILFGHLWVAELTYI